MLWFKEERLQLREIEARKALLRWQKARQKADKLEREWLLRKKDLDELIYGK